MPAAPSTLPAGARRPLVLRLLAAALLAGAVLPTPARCAPQTSGVIDGVRFEPGDWAPDLPAGQAGRSRGNHRAVVRFEGSAPAVLARVPWRRCDARPEAKDVLVVDAATGEELPDRVLVAIGSEAGEVVLRPRPGTDTYHLYYLPYETTGGPYPRLTYLPPQDTADPAWRAALGVLDGAGLARLPRARTVAIQSVDAFHSFHPMEVIATAEEVARLLGDDPRPFHLFPEQRHLPIRMRRHLPQRWVQRGLQDTFSGTARRGESYCLQVGVLAGAEGLEDVTVECSGLASADGARLGPEAITCLNTGGVDEHGEPFRRRVDVEPGTVQPLWLGVQVPLQAPVGEYVGEVAVGALGLAPQTLEVRLEVAPEQVDDGGDGRPQDMTRLRWLNSTVGSDPDFVVPPFEPVRVAGRTLSILGRDVELGDNGLPAAIRSWFHPELTRLADAPEEVLAAPLALAVTTAVGAEAWTFEPFTVQAESRSRARWSARGASPRFDLELEGALELDGMLECRMTLVARAEVALTDVALPIALVPGAARYALGLGLRGGARPRSLDWRWKLEHHQEGLWLGDVHKGLQYVLRDERYERPLNTNFYLQQPLVLPRSWHNDGRGGIRLTTDERSGIVTARNYSGPRSMAAGEALRFDVRLLITPFKPLDTRTHFETRFVHRHVPVDTVREWGGTVVNIHHATDINPYINYPFYNLEQQRAYIEEAHAKGVQVKLYYTIRELTYRAHELFALRSLGHEVLNDGEGGGHAWLQEHLREGYHAAWHSGRVDDAAVLDKGTSRWTNYYVEGLRWLAEHQGIDGLYLDDIAFSRETVKRMATVLHQHRPRVVIDLHSANQFNPRDGFVNSAFLYMEHFPYLSRLWFGEYFEYERGPDYWLTEVSGLPFGLMGEMLQDGGHPYRGLLYGMTTRVYGDVDPRPVWGLMDAFGIAQSRMLGYWLDAAPVRTDHDGVLATAYARPGAALIVLASWTPEDVGVRLAVDWAALGVDDPAVVRLVAPAVEGLQPRAALAVGDALPVPAGTGLFLLAEWD